MALSTPFSLSAFADKLPIVSAPFSLREQQELSGLGSGEILAADLGPQRWETDVLIRGLPATQARAIQALIEALDGAINPFYLYSIKACYPALDPGGVILGASAVTINLVGGDNKSLRLEGLPAGYKLSVGDMLSFDYSGRRALHRIVEAATANASGVTPTFEVRPHLRPGVATGLAVTMKKPSAKMIMVPGSLRIDDAGNLTTISFSARQTLI